MDFKISSNINESHIFFYGRCDWRLSKKSQKNFAKILNQTLSSNSPNMHIVLNFSQVEVVDYVFCAFLCELLKGRDFTLDGANEHINDMFSSLLQTIESTQEDSKTFFSLAFLSHIGKKISSFVNTFIDFLQFCGMCLWYFILSIRYPLRLRVGSVFYHINESGFKALPVVLLTAFIVSYAIALQGVLQLEKMGAPLMSVEIVAKLSLREMGPFVLAIVIAGRSASSFSAQIGVMNLTEENDALKTMNLSLYDYLVLPRVLALVIVMPLLVFVADVVSLLAAMFAVKMQTGINFVQYLERFYEYVGISHFLVGLIKTPFFGAAIALVGCFRGLSVRGDTESVGLETTKSVVNALFWVILINAIFSVITTRLNI
ncbi:MlaE family ABC transporter permease [Helicobacter sp. MIT 03-1616]|uniref:MlaE family ABC transporter permease n=1 Tax=Helicobacter sp. MIT 03-1616 TaxID=1548148 RepID=UPI0010FEAAB9|nr:ABC transporter permease [Helicobacter sp. MIT 03-1616]TLD90278.1 ABC transporter permease [Helicobacter sp. MIT 03-1616]